MEWRRRHLKTRISPAAGRQGHQDQDHRPREDPEEGQRLGQVEETEDKSQGEQEGEERPTRAGRQKPRLDYGAVAEEVDLD